MSKRAGGVAFRGAWRIASSEAWGREALDLVQPAFIRFDSQRGEFAMIAVQGSLECRYGERDSKPAVEFTWEGDSEGEDVRGRGWGSCLYSCVIRTLAVGEKETEAPQAVNPSRPRLQAR